MDLDVTTVNYPFLSTPSARRATLLLPLTAARSSIFLSTPSARRATSCWCPCKPSSSYFYPRPPRGGRPAPPKQQKITIQFLSTPSARRATNSARLTTPSCCDFYPRPPRGGRPTRLGERRMTQSISIHALREEGDISAKTYTAAVQAFLSTPSARRATRWPQS